jgi:hypothetical protein
MDARHKMSGHDAPWSAPKRSPEENPISAPIIISFFIVRVQFRGVLSRRFASMKKMRKQAENGYFPAN